MLRAPDEFGRRDLLARVPKCKPCRATRARAHYHANREREAAKARERMRRERAERPEHVRERERAYWSRPENAPRRAEQARRARERALQRPGTRERLRENWRRWRERHPEHERARMRAVQAERQARKLEQFVERVDALVVLERDDGVCGICGGDVDPFEFHVDHIVPLSRGGEHSYANVQAAHPFCNVSKGARSVDEVSRAPA